jgi:hypothetical protein
VAAIDGDRWRAKACVEAAFLPPGPWALNAFSIHGPPEARVYGAAYPTADDQAPDFHHRKTWRVSTLVWPRDDVDA